MSAARCPPVPRKGDARLHERLFGAICRRAQRPFTVDIMASPDNRQTHRFIALEAHPKIPGFVGANCMALDLARLSPIAAVPEYIYACPPWTMVPAVISHLAQCNVAGAIVAPLQPGTAWYGWLRQRAEVYELAAEGEPDVFWDARTGFTTPLPPSRTPLIVAFFDFTSTRDSE